MTEAERLEARGTNRLYNEGYYAGFTDAVKQITGGKPIEMQKPYFDKEMIMERYGGITEDRARNIIKAVRHYVGGGKLESVSMILRTELELWENDVKPNFKERL